MTAKRLGISFTLTLVVIGVVLLMTALTVVVLSGGQLGAWFQQIGETDLQTSVRAECHVKADQITRQYCSGYVGEDCTDILMSPATGYDTPASHEGCDWIEDSGDMLADVLQDSPAEDFDQSAVVRVEGNEYDCVAEGHLSRTCPPS